MIIAAALALGAVQGIGQPDDIDRFISICVDGGRGLIDQSGPPIDGKKVPEIYTRIFGRPVDKARSKLQFFRVGQNDPLAVIQQNDRGPIPWACTLMTTNFDVLSARRALLDRLEAKDVTDVTQYRLIPSNLNYRTHQRANTNVIVQDMLDKDEQIDRFMLQTSDSKFEIFGRRWRPGYYLLSVLYLGERESRKAEDAFKKCQKLDCSLLRRGAK